MRADVEQPIGIVAGGTDQHLFDFFHTFIFVVANVEAPGAIEGVAAFQRKLISDEGGVKAGGVAAYRVSSANELRPDWFSTKQTVGITAGASVPEVLVTEVVEYLGDNFEAEVEEDAEGNPEDVYFPLPLELRAAGSDFTQP